MSRIVDEHRKYLQDTVRVGAFRRAIAAAVRPGDVVLDLASGTGILGLLALDAGAGRVYSIESTGMVEIARSIAAANGLADRWTFVHGFSAHVTLPERVDLIVCDQIGHFGIEVEILQALSDVRERFLKPGGRIIPGAIDLILAPIEAPELFAAVDFWKSRPAGFDFSPARRWAANSGYPTTFGRDMLLGPPEKGASLDLLRDDASPFPCRVQLSVEHAGTLHGIGGWFFADLASGVTLTNSPVAEERIGRRNVYFPVDAPVAVEPGDTVLVSLHIIPPTTIGWNVAVDRGGSRIASFRHSTLSGMLLTPDDMRRTKPDSVPVLTDRGVARRTVLELCDGARTLAEVEREVFARHPDVCRTSADASAFVAEVVTRYTR